MMQNIQVLNQLEGDGQDDEREPISEGEYVNENKERDLKYVVNSIKEKKAHTL